MVGHEFFDCHGLLVQDLRGGPFRGASEGGGFAKNVYSSLIIVPMFLLQLFK